MAMANVSKDFHRSWGSVLLCATLAVGLRAAEPAAGAASATAATAGSPTAAALSKTAAPAPAAKPAPTPAPKAPAAAKPEEAILFSQTVGRRHVVGRVDPDGRCKAFLGKPGEGWIGHADPKGVGNDLQAVSSADGSRLALLREMNGSVNLWLLSADARDWKQLTDDDGGILDVADASGPVLAFSPDSKRLAFINRGALWVLALDGEQPRTLTVEHRVRSLAWSPDSRWIAYVLGKSVHKIDVSGAPDLLMAADQADLPGLAWHPDPKEELLFFFGRGLRRVDARRRVSLLAATASQPNAVAVLPGGKQVALLVPSAGRNEVYLLGLGDKGGAGLVQVTQEGAESVLASSNGKHLYFIRDGVAWRCDTDGRKARPLGSVKMDAVRTAMLPPLKGVCP